MKYEYLFVEVPVVAGYKTKFDETFEEVKRVITKQSELGWRLKEVLSPATSDKEVYKRHAYQLIFEKEVVSGQ